MLIVKGVLQLAWSDSSVSFNSIVIFKKGTSIDTLGWSFSDIIPFLLLGALCGVVSGIATHLGLMMQKYRKSAAWRVESDWKKVTLYYVLRAAFRRGGSQLLDEGCQPGACSFIE